MKTITSLLITALFAAASTEAKPLKVFILAGQSNMQGHANVSTFDSMADDPKTTPLLKEMRNADGTPRVCQKVWISSVGCADDDTTEQKGKVTVGFGASTEEIGPEFTFGIYLEKLLDEPVLLIKTSWGGKSLHTDVRPPSAGPYVWTDDDLAQRKEQGEDLKKAKAEKIKDTGVYYRDMIRHVRKVLADIKRVVPEYDPKQGYELAGFVWFQGWNDFVDESTYRNQNQPGGYDLYGQLLAQFIRDVRKDLSAPKMPFVIGVMGIGGLLKDTKTPQMYFRQAQAAPASLPEFKGNVVAVQTAPYWDYDLAALNDRLDSFNEKMDGEEQKNPNLTPEEKEAARKKGMAESFTAEELKRLKGVSHWGCHYIGAAKIIAPIGKAFADAMVEFQKPQRWRNNEMFGRSERASKRAIRISKDWKRGAVKLPMIGTEESNENEKNNNETHPHIPHHPAADAVRIARGGVGGCRAAQGGFHETAGENSIADASARCADSWQWRSHRRVRRQTGVPAVLDRGE
jgi:hypothetical protein